MQTQKKYLSAYYNNFMHRCVSRTSEVMSEDGEPRVFLDFIALLDISQVSHLSEFVRVQSYSKG